MNFLEHSSYAENHRSDFTIWIKIKDRFENDRIAFSILGDIHKWALKHNIETEFGNHIQFQGRLDEISRSNRFYTAIFTKDEFEVNVVKMVWGEYLCNRS